MPERQFQVGDRVMLRADSRYSDQNSGEGTIVAETTTNGYEWSVFWDRAVDQESRTALYNSEDLILTQRTMPEETTNERIVMPIQEYKNEADIGDFVKFYDESLGEFISGLVGEINENRFYVFQDSHSGNMGTIPPRTMNCRYSWCVDFENAGDIEIISKSNKTILEETVVTTKKLTVSKKAKKKFYQMFQIGIEIEGEFLRPTEEINRLLQGSIISAGTDGSITTRNGGYAHELRTGIMQGVTDEKKVIDLMTSLETERNGKKLFAHFNTTCGTHIHFSLNPEYAEKLPKLSSHNQDDYVRLFDSIEFEKYFIRQYFRHFKLKKFWDRITNSYCAPFISWRRKELGEGKVQIIMRPHGDNVLQIERAKIDRSKYMFLNMDSVNLGRGAEIRLFPHVQTAEGLLQMINFTQYVMLRYWKRKEKKLKLIKDFYDLKLASTVRKDKMGVIEKIAIDSMFFERHSSKFTLDFMEMLTTLAERSPDAFIKR